MSSAGTPTISRTGRLPGTVSAASANATPTRSISSASLRVLYSSEAATAALCSGVPSRASQRGIPSAPVACTLLLTATWVCRLGSPARESRWSNAAAISPVVLTWAIPSAPMRENAACSSRKAIASATAWWWHSSITRAMERGASAQSTDTDLTGVNVRS